MHRGFAPILVLTIGLAIVAAVSVIYFQSKSKPTNQQQPSPSPSPQEDKQKLSKDIPMYGGATLSGIETNQDGSVTAKFKIDSFR